MAEYKRNPNTVCNICKKPIYRRPSEIETNNGRVYCGNTCYGISCRKEQPCKICGKLILAIANKKTCSRKCANINRTGISYRLNQPRSKVKDYRSLKIRVMKIKGNSCERCGYNKFEILHLHHKDKNRHNNKLDNLEIICPNCHFEEHYLENSWLKNE